MHSYVIGVGILGFTFSVALIRSYACLQSEIKARTDDLLLHNQLPAAHQLSMPQLYFYYKTLSFCLFVVT